MPRASKTKRDRSREAAREAVARAGTIPDEPTAPATKGRASEPFTGALRRGEILPLLVLHLIAEGPTYGNQLMERIADMTEGVLSVNPNTMYPLLYRLKEQGLIAAQWEHPERRTRRFYSITPEGQEEYARLREEARPFLDSIARSIDDIVREVYG